MSKLIASVLLLLIAASLPAQDTIRWVDGKVTKNCRVTDFTVGEIRFVERGSREAKPSDQVAELDVAKAKDTYRRAWAVKDSTDGPDTFLLIARKEAASSPFLAQFGYWHAARLYADFGKTGDAFTVGEELIEKLPDAGYVPHIYVLKCEYYLATGKAKSADKVARDYNQAATTKGWPDGFLRESEYYLIMAEAVGGALKPSAMRTRLETLLTTTDGRFQSVANRCRLQIAHSLRAEGQVAEAIQLYEKLVSADSADKSTIASAMLGVGMVRLAEGTPENTEPYRQALLAFLRVYTNAQDSAPDLVAEALYHGSEASLKWGGPDHRLMAGRLRSILRNDSRFAESEWAKK